MLIKQQPIRIFYSYAQNDTFWLDKLMSHMELLNKQKLTISLHRRMIQAGESFDERIADLLRNADIILLLLSSDFFVDDCYSKEMLRAVKLHSAGKVCVIPIMVRPFDQVPGTPYAALKALPEDGRAISLWESHDEALSHVARCVRQVVEDMQRRRRPQITDPDSPALLIEREHAQVYRFLHLRCDRYRQWALVEGYARTRQNEILLLPGANRLGHEFFLSRVKEHLSGQEAIRIRQVSWDRTPPFPCTQEDFFASLAVALGCSEMDIVPSLRLTLNRTKLLLLHPRVDRGFDSKALFMYYTEWLPALLARAGGSHALKCIQPVSWEPHSCYKRLAAMVWQGIHASDEPSPILDSVLGQQRARLLMQRITNRQRTSMPVYELPALTPITVEEVREFCQIEGMPQSLHRRFIHAVMSSGRAAEDILHAMEKHLPHYQTLAVKEAK